MFDYFCSMIKIVPLFLSDVAGSEILLIMLFVLLFFGSNAIPGIARSMGRTMRQIKDASQEVQEEIRKSAGDMKGDFEIQNRLNQTVKQYTRPFEEQATEMSQSIDDQSARPNKPTEFTPTQSIPLDQLDQFEQGEKNK